MLVLPRKAIDQLVTTGQVEHWTPTHNTPDLRIQHVVRVTARGETITHARGVYVRETVLQALTLDDARSAGFRTEDEFLTWWRRRYATGPLMGTIECWATTYRRIDLEIPQFLGRRGYTPDQHRAIDYDETEAEDGKIVRVPLEAVTDPAYLREWSAKAETDRLGRAAELRAAWRRRRRGQQAA